MKSKYFILLAILSGPLYCMAQSGEQYGELISAAETNLRQAQYMEAFNNYTAAFEISERPVDLYNAACAAAQAGQNDPACRLLFRRLDIDKEWRSDVARDTDLLPLHGDPRWVVLTDSLHNRRESYENRFERPLRDKLKRILRDDQDIRQEYVSRQAKGASQHTLDSLMMRMHELDLVNEQKIADLLDKYGWLDGSRVGDMASVQFIVLQHAPLETQLKYRELLREGVERGDIAAAQYAMFEDRIAVRSGEKQRYGTQILFDAEGNPYVAPCVDEGQLEKWRSEVGLPPMNQYLKRWGLEWE